MRKRLVEKSRITFDQILQSIKGLEAYNRLYVLKCAKCVSTYDFSYVLSSSFRNSTPSNEPGISAWGTSSVTGKVPAR